MEGDESKLEDQNLPIIQDTAEAGESFELFDDDFQRKLFRVLLNVIVQDEASGLLCLDWSALDAFLVPSAPSSASPEHPQIEESKSGDNKDDGIQGSRGDRFIDRVLHLIERCQQKHDRKWKKTQIRVITWTEDESDEESDTSSGGDDDEEYKNYRVGKLEFGRAQYKKKGGREEEKSFWKQAAALENISSVDVTYRGETNSFDPNKSPSHRFEEIEKVRKCFSDVTMSEIEVRELFQKTLQPVLLDTQTKLGVPSPISTYISDLVQYHPNMSEIQAAMAGSELKSKVIAIAGESGSGKTRFAVDGLSPTAPRFYILLDDDDLKDKPEPEPVQRAWHWLVLKAIAYLEKSKGKNDTSEEIIAILDNMRTRLNQTRNKWAENVFLKALKRTNLQVEEWFTGVKKTEALSRDILCIVDEAGKDIDFVNGMVDIAESFFAAKAKKLGKIRLVLCGTRLDAIKHGASGSFVGSNPNKSLVVEMKGTCLNALAQRVDSTLVTAVTKGTYSRILGTNVRILTKILLPFLYSAFAGFHTSAQTRESHQIQVGSNWVSMAFVPVAYFSLNGLGNVEVEERDKLLLDAFKFFAKESISSAGAVVRPDSVAIDPDTVNFADDNDIFKRGLATTDASDSPAIKFLACNGLVCPVLRADGDSLEQALLLHLCRLLEVRSFNPRLYTLSGAWPPASSGKERLLWTDELDEYQFADSKHISELMKPGCGIVVRQGVKNAQGPDVIALYPVNDNEWVLDIYQCKNEDDPSTPATYAETLGVRVQDDDSSVAERPADGENVDKPYRAHAAMMRFCQALQNGSGWQVKINRRVLLWKGNWPKKPSEKGYRLREAYDNSPVELWTREFLSPSLDCFLP